MKNKQYARIGRVFPSTLLKKITNIIEPATINEKIVPADQEINSSASNI